MKIDEAPTPYEFETLADEDDEQNVDTKGCKNGEDGFTGDEERRIEYSRTNELKYSWENLAAKLEYEKQLQEKGENSRANISEDNSNSDTSSNNNSSKVVPNTVFRPLTSSDSVNDRDCDEMEKVQVKEKQEENNDDVDKLKEDFKMKRNKHYNEFQIMKAMREKMAMEDEDEEDDDNDDD